jgi:hypothetical protein
MEFIRSIIPYIAQEKFAKQLETAKQLSKLFDLIRFEQVNDNEEARIELFGENGSRDAYKRIRLRLRERLMEHIALNGIEHKNIDSYARIFLRCLNQLNATKALIYSGSRSTSVIIGEQLIKTTIKYEFTDLTLMIARDLCYYYYAIGYDRVKAKKYQTILDDTQILYIRELDAHNCYCSIRTSFITTRGSNRKKLLNRVNIDSDRLRKYVNSKNLSYQLVTHTYNVLAMQCEIAGDYVGLLAICDEAIALLRGREINRKPAFLQFDLFKVGAYMQLGDYANAESVANQYFKIITPGLLNWFVLKLYVFVAQLHSRKYQNAYEILAEITLDKGYMKTPWSLRQTWTVYEAHIEFLIAIGKVQTDQPSKFRLNKFLNEIPFYTKDKQGLNIAILIIHVLFLLQQRKYSQIIDRVDALKQYCYRYLRKDDTFRSNCFIRMLLQMPRADFNRIRTERYAEPFLTKLRSVPIVVSEQSIEVEVIPYEDLWEMTLELLD